MTYRSMVTEGGRVLAAAGVPEAELDAWYLLEYLRKERGERSDRQWYLLNREDEARAEEEKVYQELIERRGETDSAPADYRGTGIYGPFLSGK